MKSKISGGTASYDFLFKYLTLAFGSAIILLVLLIAYELMTGSWESLSRFGLSFLTTSTWDPVHEIFGALPMLYGSVVSTGIALLISVPVSIGVAVFLSELAPDSVRNAISFLVELLAAIPSVVYGLWGLFVLAPYLQANVYPVIQNWLGFLPIFSGHIYGIGMLTAGIVLALMTIPIISSVTRDSLLAVPVSQKEAAYALGTTKFEMIRIAVLGYARSGILAAIFLGFGRAFGETMAVTMVIGNTPNISASLFAPGYTLASVIANEFTEATTHLYVSVLIELGLILFAVSFIVNALARYLIHRFVSETAGAELI
jgi:phosphate transport system permease protein